MKIDIDSIPEGYSHISLCEDPSELGVVDEAISFEEPIRIELDASRGEREILLRGRATTDVTLECARCLERYKMKVEAEIDVMYLIGGGSSSSGAEETNVIDLPLGARSIDISDEVRTELLVVIPIKPLCDPGCKGLCPICGTNLNTGSCACEHDNHDSRWDALRKLK